MIYSVKLQQLQENEREILTNSIEQFIIPSNLIITNKEKNWSKCIFQDKNIQINDDININQLNHWKGKY